MMNTKESRTAMLLLLFGTVLEAGGSCFDGSPCVLWSDCPTVLSLASVGGKGAREAIQKLNCGTQDRQPKVCCKSDILPTTCGMVSIDERITDGDRTSPGEFPFMALVGYAGRGSPTSVSWDCGGVLITSRYVLTAAHCVLPPLQVLKIRLGEYDLRTEVDCTSSRLGQSCAPKPQDFTPENVLAHPSYNTKGLYNDDIALIRLNRPALLNSYVQPICIPSATFDVFSFVGNRSAIVAGWGRTETGVNSNVLLKARVPLQPLEVCHSTFARFGSLVDRQLCFGGKGTKDSCGGDSGGPVFISETLRPPYTLLALVSFGLTQCGKGGVPAIYTNVIPYRDWIINNIEQ